MKKAFAILGILAALAAAAFGAYYLGLNTDRSGGSPDENKTQAFEETSTQLSSETEPQLLGEMVIGIWQDYPAVGSGLSDCYRFYEGGTYVFEPGGFVSDPEASRQPRSSGTWEADGDSITLHMTQKTVVEGGAWVEDPIVGFILEGGTEKTIEASEEIHTLYLGVFVGLPRDMLSIGGRTFWKLSGDPNDYLD